MAQTRTRNRTAPPRSASQREQSRPLRTSLARRSKPTKSLYVDDSGSTSDGDNGYSSESGDSATDDDADISARRIRDDLHMNDTTPSTANTPQAQRSSRTSRNTSTRNTSGPSTRQRSRATRSRDAKKQPKGVKRRRALGSSRGPGTPSKRARRQQKDGDDIPPGVIPDWRDSRIPYTAWADIFYYAANQSATDSLDTNWLLGAASTCKAFAEPALTTLYRSPILRTSAKARKLAALLERPISETLFNYRAKIEVLMLNIETMPLAVLHQIVRPLRRLKELIIFTPFDQPPYRDLDRTVRWQYPDELFQALMPREPSDTGGEVPDPTILRNWEWSRRLLGGPVPDMAAIANMHTQPSFSRLTRVSFTNFQVPSLHKADPRADDEEGALQMYQEDVDVIDRIAHAISQLKFLRHLVFESSTVMSDYLLGQLPKDLVHLELINCWEVKSEDLAAFLRTHGSHMRALTLSHNQSLDMAFLTDLSETCPNLRELRMNLSYYRHHESIDDADPMYEQALLPHQVPQWPSSLRLLEIEHVRHWSVEAAEMFFQSLINSAPNLPDLRYLAIKTMLNIPWQTRATMRREWRDKLEHVFLRPWVPPQLHATLRPKLVDEAPPATPTVKKQKAFTDVTPSRRSGRIVNHASDSDRLSDGSKSGRLRKVDRPLYRDPDTDEDEEEEFTGPDAGKPAIADDTREEEANGDQKESGKPFVQGMCHTVSLLFDNQKARELQYGMEDFFDDDSESSEEEWDGDKDDEDDAVYAWR